MPNKTGDRVTVERASAASPVKGSAPEPPKPRPDWVSLAGSAPAVLGVLGLVVYALARVGHDAFYARFGVTAEEVGLSETTILARAALYFAFFLTAATAVLGLSVMFMLRTPTKSAEGDVKADGGADWAPGRVLLIVAACAGFGSALVAGFNDSWPITLAIGVITPLTLVLLLVKPRPEGYGAAAGLFLGLLAAWAASAAFVVGNTGLNSSPGTESFSVLSKLLLWFLCLTAGFAAASGSLSRAEMSRTAGERDRPESPQRQVLVTALSLLVLTPLAFALIAPGTVRFVTDAGDRTVTALFMWAAFLSFFGVLAFGNLLSGSSEEWTPVLDVLLLVLAASVFAVSTFYLQYLKGIDLANQALVGSRVSQTGFGMLSVRADIVCLEPINLSEGQGPTGLPQKPVIYLGQSNNMLVLFDLPRHEALRAREDVAQLDIGAPQVTPLRVPATGVMVRVATLLNPAAKYAVSVRGLAGRWDC